MPSSGKTSAPLPLHGLCAGAQGAIGVGAATALVLGLTSSLLAQAGHITSLEDLASRQLAPHVRTGVASAFDIMFIGVALMLLLALTLFFKV